jgi:Lar family restriction alleviation protein
MTDHTGAPEVAGRVPRLLPCPFCGSHDVEAASPTYSWFLIRCLGCGIEVDSFGEDPTGDDIMAAKWNRRAANKPR